MKKTKTKQELHGIADALNFVQGSLARHDHIPALSHFYVKDGFIGGYSGIVHLRCRIPIDLTVVPKGEPFLKAIAACKDTIQMYVNDAGKLAVLSGKLHTLIDCISIADFPVMEPSGHVQPLPMPILPALRMLRPFISTDQSRPWGCGVLLNEGCACATNNIVLVQYWLGQAFNGCVNIPAAAVDEILRIDEEPESIQMGTHNLTFNFSGQRRLLTQLLESKWPNVEQMLEATTTHPALFPVPAGLFDALAVLAPFCNERRQVFFHGSCIATTAQPQSSGTAISIDNVPNGCCFNIDHLLNLQGVADFIAFNNYPATSLFTGSVARGVICGTKP